MQEPTYYPLSSIQRGLAFLFRFYPDLHILNLAARLDFEEEIDEELLLKAVRGGKPGLKWEPPLVLAEDDGSPSDEYRRIYRMEQADSAASRL